MPDMGKRCAMGFQPFRNEQGAILVIALVFVCILAISGTVAYRMTANELLIARNFDGSREALNAASAGIEEARVRLGLTSTDTYAIYDPATGSSYPDPDWIATPTSLQPDPPYQIEVIHRTVSPSGFYYYGYKDPFSSFTISAFSPSPPTDPTEYRPIDIITSTGTSGNSGIEIRAEVVRNPGPPILAALYAESDVDGDADADDDGIDDLIIEIEGDDNCAFTPSVSCPQCGTAPNKGVDLYVCTLSTTTSIQINVPTLTADNITLGPLNLNISQGITSLKEWETNPDSGLSTCLGNSDYNICYSDNEPTPITGQTGSGILLMEGNLTLEGTTWSGLILVTGELTLNGGAGIVIEGAVLANWKVWINDTNEGPVTINYNSCAIDAALSSIPLRVLSWEDRSITE